MVLIGATPEFDREYEVGDMDLGIAGRRTLLAGSTSGMGAEIATFLPAEGLDEEQFAPEILKLIRSHISLGRGGSERQLGSTACVLASEHARSGATLRVEGGNTGSISI